ncbi:MAG TPA: hypothetical protein VGG49_05435 [Steroidobacteraceae bacterium]|jgi:hypothetical protein
MEPDPVDEMQAALQQRVSRVLAGTAQFKAPQDIEITVLCGIERRAHVPWWRRRVLEWPRLAQLAFLVTGIAAALGVLLGRPATPAALGIVLREPAAVLRQPAADLHATLSVLAVFHRVTDTVAGSLPDDVWYGGLALCAAAYLALFLLVALGYRLLQSPLTSR